MTRMMLYTFHGPNRSGDATRPHLAEAPWVMTGPLVVLGVLSAIGGWLNLPELVTEMAPIGKAGGLEHWLEPYLAGCVSINDIANLDLALILRSGLPYELGHRLDALAPERIELANGRSLRITYRGEEPPMISARAQHFYGTSSHPAIMNGAVPLVVELLSPADRPIQVTSDLPAFWSGSWAEVRKDMAGRYPKHDWPVNPAT